MDDRERILSAKSPDEFDEAISAVLSSRLQPTSRDDEEAIAFGVGEPDLEGGRRFLTSLADLGLVTPAWPVEHGGLAAPPSWVALIRKALRRYDVPDLYPFVVGLGIAAPTLLQFGSQDQIARYLPPIRHGSEIWCQLFSEPGAGSDLAAVSTRAQRVKGGWRIGGSKIWSSRANYADRGLCLVRTDASAPKHRGLSMLVVDMAAPGVTIRPIREMNGQAHFNEVFLDDVTVRAKDCIGPVNAGWTVTRAALAHERVPLPVGKPAAHPANAVERLMRLAATRKLTSNAIIRDRLIRVWIEVQASSLASRRDRSKSAGEPQLGGSASKLRSVQIEKAIADLALEIEGLAGLTGESEWTMKFLTAPSLSLRGGTDEIQRNILGERVLGLPAEPRVDKEVPGNASVTPARRDRNPHF